jgi:hypothetical protein
MTKAHNLKQTVVHTPEPWEHGDNGLIYGQCEEDDVEAPFVCDVIEDSAMQALGMLSPVEEANARRICAAVNACKGISTEVLKHGIVRELLERIQAVAELRRKWRSQDEAETIDSIEYMDGLDALELDDLIAKASRRAA